MTNFELWHDGADQITQELADLGFAKGCISLCFAHLSWPATEDENYRPGVIISLMVVGKYGDKYKVHSTDGWSTNIHGYVFKEDLLEMQRRLQTEGDIGITMHRRD